MSWPESNESERRPRDPDTGRERPAVSQPGYYPGYSTMSQSKFWDAATRELLVNRVASPPARRFFNEGHWRFWTAVFDHLIPQSDRAPERRIPIVAPLDARLFENRTAGYRFEDMPHDRFVYRSLGVHAINAEAQARYSDDFLALDPLGQEIVLRAIHDGRPIGGEDIWARMSVHRFWQMLMTDAIDAYYAHPWAWDEIGYGGPAYPRAYTRLERGDPEPWEVEEQRYEWEAPEHTVSDDVNDASHHHTEAEQHRHQPSARSE
jgi:Gluconate 2-dehydrogenase subunit 3